MIPWGKYLDLLGLSALKRNGSRLLMIVYIVLVNTSAAKLLRAFSAWVGEL
jgi:hypothetical protein